MPKGYRDERIFVDDWRICSVRNGNAKLSTSTASTTQVLNSWCRFTPKPGETGIAVNQPLRRLSISFGSSVSHLRRRHFGALFLRTGVEYGC